MAVTFIDQSNKYLIILTNQISLSEQSNQISTNQNVDGFEYTKRFYNFHQSNMTVLFIQSTQNLHRRYFVLATNLLAIDYRNDVAMVL